jgi:polar amino acid transport system substrate-binding protein
MNGIKLGFAFGVSVLLSLGPSASAQELVKAGYAPFAPPLSFLPGATPDNYRTFDPNGALAQGAMIDLVNAIAKDAGFRVQFVMVPASEQIAALGSNKIDLALMVRIEKGAAAEFTDPLYKDSEALLVKKSDPKHYVTWEDLKGEVVVALKGSVVTDAAQQSGLFKEVRLVTAGAEIAQAVRKPEIRAGFKGSFIDTTYDQQHGAYEPDVQMSMSYQPKFAIERAVGARKGDALLSKVNASLLKFKNDGTLKTIFNKYGIDGTLVR